MGVEGEERFVNEQGIIEDDYRIEFVRSLEMGAPSDSRR